MDKGIHFIEKYYKNLYYEIKNKRTSKKINKYNDINNYFNRIEYVSNKAIYNNKIDLLYKLYYKKYITSTDENVKENLKESLKPWLDYLITKDTKTPFWVKYYIFQGMIKVGSFNKDKGSFNKRISKTKAPFIEFNETAVKRLSINLIKYVNEEAMDKNIHMLFKHGNFISVYLNLLNDIKKQEIKDNNGIWIKYNEGCMEDAYKLYNSVNGKTTFWCINSLNYAIESIMGSNKIKSGDFYIYYTKDKDNNYTIPRLAIKSSNNTILEIKGVLDVTQNIENSMLPVLEKKLNKLNFLSDIDREYYLKAINDYKETIRLYTKTRNNISFTKEELDFIFEINEPIYLFSDQYDQRIDFIRNNHTITDKDFLLKSSKRIDNVLKFANDELKNDKEVVESIIKDKYYLLDLVGKNLRDDKEFMLPIIKNDPFYIRFASEKLKNDREIALIVLNNNLEYFRYMNISLLKDESFIEDASQIPGFSKKYILKK